MKKTQIPISRKSNLKTEKVILFNVLYHYRENIIPTYLNLILFWWNKNFESDKILVLCLKLFGLHAKGGFFSESAMCFLNL